MKKSNETNDILARNAIGCEGEVEGTPSSGRYVPRRKVMGAC